jgi:predicted small metal-binding protein
MGKGMINFRKEKPRARALVLWVASGRRGNMMEKLLRCRDLGIDCDFEACGDTPEEVLKTAVDHARVIHGLKRILEKDGKRAWEAIQDAFCVPKGGYTRGGGDLY